MKIKSLNEVISFNNNFKTAINLYLSLNKTEKILNYIPTKSSVHFMNEYLEAIIRKNEHATLLVGPYGKGKSHLLLVLMAILSLDRNSLNFKIINQLMKSIKNVEEVGDKTTLNIEKVWKTKRFLPVIINDTKGDLNQAFLIAISDALKRNKLDSLVPNTYYSEALRRIDEWEKNYKDTFIMFEKSIKKKGYNVKSMRGNLKNYEKEALDVFKEIYPTITAGSSFNPLTVSEVLPLYKSVSEKLVEDYGYSGIYIVFDEFSKFIEGLDGTHAGHTMKLLQDICELASESANSQIYITMVAHKSIKEYGKYLSSDIINAFTGIEGRIQEKFFITSSKNNYELIRNAIVKNNDIICNIKDINRFFSEENVKKYYQLPIFKTNFNKEDFINIVLKGCYPLNPIAVYLLLNISEKVAQNERTLFTFISNNEPFSLARYVSEHDTKHGWIIGADLIYDYFSGLFKKEVSNELVHNIWLGAEYAISKCTNNDEKKIIKTLALINIVNKGEELSATEKFLSLGASLDDGTQIIKSLEDNQLIYKKSSINAYVFKTKAGVELKAELQKQRAIKGNDCNYSKTLQLITGKYFVIPRKYNTETMMTRYFKHEYMDFEVFLSISDASTLFDAKDFSDGKVITLYGFSKCNDSEIKEHFEKLECNKLIVNVPKRPIQIAKLLRDYEILQQIKENQNFINTNAVLKKEIVLLEEDITKEVEEKINGLYLTNDCKVMFWQNGSIKLVNSNEEEFAVNECCNGIYSKTPIINNEIINRTFITTAQTRKTRLNIIEAILNGKDDEDFYGGTNQEATIYRSLFEKSSVCHFDVYNNIGKINKLLNNFVDQCSDRKVSLSKIINKLIAPPYGMRLGGIPIYLAKVLASRNEDLIVYFTDIEVQITPEIVVNMCENSESYSLFVSKADIQKEKYINNLNKLFEVEGNRALTENRIKNIVMCMQRWYRALPQITRNLAGLDKYKCKNQLKTNMLSLKKMLQKINLNPYEILFSTIFTEFNVFDFQSAFKAIKECREAFDSYFSNAIEIVVKEIYTIFKRQKNLDLYHLLKEWYENQSALSKQGLHSSNITNFMSCIEKLDVYSDEDVAQKIVKAVTNVYIDNWIDDAYDDFVTDLKNIKNNIEKIKDKKEKGRLELSFIGSNGQIIKRFYERVDEGTGTILRNIIEDTLEEYDDLSVNDRVAILLEMIEKVIG